MELYPAIDLLQGKVVRLRRGDFDAVTVYADNPVATAQEYASAGARWLHLVDLDGARGTGDNRALIEQVIAGSGLKVEVGGGIRSLAVIEAMAAAGAARVVLGTSLLADPGMVAEAISRFGDLICAAVDARDGRVAISGWLETSEVDVLDLAARLAELGIRHFLYTDVNRDGLQTGIDAHAYQQLHQVVGCPVIASGGIAALDDLCALRTLGSDVIEGVIVGRAIYEKVFSVQQALAALTGRDKG
ncbi:MAG: 1-(5-phosphoribosyl)-5-[(5-phosphoribosylamino)methylideneamino]imidazole-4-carboxamide isomerase [Actinomycetia bacterium]|nr:1-(5-phosphoribosyl)-5-[(5-phosphoribosylamino)methylideneamino]imidazole-4-carboxamide isomerase [Actinomycetes bacterium]